MTAAQLADLRAQAKATARLGYDRHQHQPVWAPMAVLSTRRARRRWRQRLTRWVRERALAAA